MAREDTIVQAVFAARDVYDMLPIERTVIRNIRMSSQTNRVTAAATEGNNIIS